jgi:FlaA1/EpsC-like NDP-sugar epimerase
MEKHDPAVSPVLKSLALTRRQLLVIAHDLLATAAAVIASFYIRFELAGLESRLDRLVFVLPGFLVCAAVVFFVLRLHGAKWRFTSVPDLGTIVRAATALAVVLLILDYFLVSPTLYGTYFFGKTTIVLYWFLQIAFLAGTRVAYRHFRFVRTRHHARGSDTVPCLVLGRAADTEVLLRAIESGATSHVRAVGILSPSFADRGQSIRGIPVVGNLDDLEQIIKDANERGERVTRLIFTASALVPEVSPETLLMRARRLGLQTSRLPSLAEGGEALQLAPIAVEDLLLRESVAIDYRRLEQFIRDKSIVVTGGGGSIGSEICDRVITFGAARLLVVEHSEVALHTVCEAIRAKSPQARVEGRIADVRDRERIFGIFADFKPDIVFHAAALKHVPLLERDWGEGVKTNVFGSVNVADAAAAAGATAMVMISTDKAIEPVSVLGATKRFAEMYCQALDADFARRNRRPAMRMIAVRFGNVLASNGSVVPKFKQQIEAGGPLTVTHPDMVRYFMTIREACDLVVTAASHALGPERSGVSVYVLNMGQPVRIMELAERMIRLSGLEPGRDIRIEITGVRPGERLNEILFAHNEPEVSIGIEGIVAAKPTTPSVEAMRGWMATLEQGLARNDRSVIYGALRDAVPDFSGEAA